MSDRERWIVYPLLFMALGMSLRDKAFPARQVATHNLVVVNDDDEQVVTINALKEGHAVIRVRRGDRELDLLPRQEDAPSQPESANRRTAGGKRK